MTGFRVFRVGRDIRRKMGEEGNFGEHEKDKGARRVGRIIGTVILVAVSAGLGVFIYLQFFSETPPIEVIPRSQARAFQSGVVDPSDAEDDKTMQITLFFPGRDPMELEREDRIVPFEREPGAIGRIVVNEILKGPSEYGLSPVAGPGAALRTVFIRGDVLYIDFSRTIVDSVGRSALSEVQLIKSLCRTLYQTLPDIRWVRFLVNGKEGQTLNREDGHLDIGSPFPITFKG